MMKSNRTLAIVLRRTNYGEADRILQLLTPDGKISVMAKGVRKEKSRLAGGIELFSICEISVGEGKGDLGVLISARLIRFFNHIIEDYDRMQFGYLAIKLLSTVSEAVEATEWYDLLAETLAGLDSTTTSLDLIQAWFYLRYAELTGYELGLWRDINGDKIVENSNYQYDATDRGLKLKESGELNSDHIKLLRLISTKPLKVLVQVGGINEIVKICAFVARQHAAV